MHTHIDNRQKYTNHVDTYRDRNTRIESLDSLQARTDLNLCNRQKLEGRENMK